MLLLGLFLTGVLHVLVSKTAVLRWLSEDNLKSVCASSALGVPIPLCSCSVVPVVAEMRKKGASRSSCISFLITAPETGVDSIMVTHAFFGFVAAVVRPLVSFVTAVVTGILCIGLMRDNSIRSQTGGSDEPRDDSDASAHDHAPCADIHDHDDCHGHQTHTPLMTASADCDVSPSQFKSMFQEWALRVAGRTKRRFSGVRAATQPEATRSSTSGNMAAPEDSGEVTASGGPADRPSLGRVVRHIFRYGFVEVADDILFALVIGILLSGLVFLAVPEGVMSSEHARWISYPIMVLVGVPLYICASASTPIAAALVTKGLSPGAALIFLTTGPATNSGTIAVIVSQFGTRFASIYVAGVIASTTAIGVLIDVVLVVSGLTLPVTLTASESPTIQLVEWSAAAILIGLIVWRFRAGALKSGYHDLVANLAPLLRRSRKTRKSVSDKDRVPRTAA